jgi:DNA-binding transcriptional LysR family regulator
MATFMSGDHGTPEVLLDATDIGIILDIVDEGTFTGAAHKRDVTQSAISRSVQHMEQLLGVELFSRGRVGAIPSTALVRVLPRLRNIQSEIKYITQDLTHGHDTELRGPIRIAGFRSAVSVILPPAVSKFMKRHSKVNVSLSVVRENGPGVIHSLDEGTADLAITTVRPPARFRAIFLGSDRYVVVRPSRAAGTDPGAMRNLILWSERCSEIVPAILHAHNYGVTQQMQVDSDTAVLALIAHGAGFTIMPELAAEPLPHNVETQHLEIEFRRNVWLCGTPSALQSRVGRVLTGYIRRAANAWLKTEQPFKGNG